MDIWKKSIRQSHCVDYQQIDGLLLRHKRQVWEEGLRFMAQLPTLKLSSVRPDGIESGKS